MTCKTCAGRGFIESYVVHDEVGISPCPVNCRSLEDYTEIRYHNGCRITIQKTIPDFRLAYYQHVTNKTALERTELMIDKGKVKEEYFYMSRDDDCFYVVMCEKHTKTTLDLIDEVNRDLSSA